MSVVCLPSREKSRNKAASPSVDAGPSQTSRKASDLLATAQEPSRWAKPGSLVRGSQAKAHNFLQRSSSCSLALVPACAALVLKDDEAGRRRWEYFLASLCSHARSSFALSLSSVCLSVSLSPSLQPSLFLSLDPRSLSPSPPFLSVRGRPCLRTRFHTELASWLPAALFPRVLGWRVHLICQ